MVQKIYSFLEFFTFLGSSNYKRNSIIYFLFSPIFLILEFICYKFIWKRIIITEMLTNDNIVNFLNKNEFGYKFGKLKKADIIDNEFLNDLSLEDAKHAIKKDFIEAFIDIFKTNTQLNIEDYLTLIVKTELKTFRVKSEYVHEKVYYVTIQFCRQFYLTKSLKNALILLLSVSILLSAIFVYFNHPIF